MKANDSDYARQKAGARLVGQVAALVRAMAMVDEELARETIGELGTAAAMLIEDAHPALVTLPADAVSAAALTKTLARLGDDLRALGAAAAVLVRSEP